MQRILPPCCLFLATTFLLVRPVSAQEPIEVLIVSGANNHDWRWTTPSLQSMLTESGKFNVTITYDPAKDLADAKALSSYATVLLDYNGPRWGQAAEQTFLKAVNAGLGVSVIHAANNAFPGWTEYEQLVGHLWRKGTGHGRFHEFGLRVLDYSHPITATMPDFVDHPDELYHRLVRVEGPARDVIGVSHSSKESGGTGVDEPMIIVGTYGKGRMFHTPLAHVWERQEHTKVSHADPQLRSLIVRGTEWAATGKVTDGLKQPNTLSAAEANQGWRLLFDGQSARGWQSAKGSGFPAVGWSIQSGCLRHTSGGGDLLSIDTFDDFELAFEWKVARGTNSGVKYRVQRTIGGLLGPEYQILDDPGTDEANNPLSAAGALYAIQEAQNKELLHAGSFNHARVICRNSIIEHWLNGKRTLRVDLDSEGYQARLAKSKFKNVAGFARAKPGHILLQDHGGEVWYRSIRIRPLSSEREWQPLLSGDDLSGWTVEGGAHYTRSDNQILGDVGSGQARNSFLVTDKEYGDFQFSCMVRVVEAGNSGIQFRSARRPKDGLVFGYQAELDCSNRAWSGGIYDELRRGWIANLEDNPAGRAAFRVDQWNHYLIQAQGPQLRVWVNGIQTANLIDQETSRGFIGLQVHSGNKGSFQWDDLRIREL